MALFKVKPWYKKKGGGTPSYYGTVDNLSAGVERPAATFSINGSYVAFGGGNYWNNGIRANGIVDFYDTSLTHSTGSLHSAVQAPAAAHTKYSAMFFGGDNSYYYTSCFNSAKVLHTLNIPSFGYASYNAAGASGYNGDYAIFAGGQRTGSESVDKMYLIYKSETYSTSQLSTARHELASAVINENYPVIFAGGRNNNSGYGNDTVDYLLASATLSRTSISNRAYGLAGASVGSYALFAGGCNDSVVSDVVNAFNKSMTRSLIMSLSVPRYFLTGVSTSKYALFAGGCKCGNPYIYYDNLDVYDASLTRVILLNLPTTLSMLASTTLRSYPKEYIFFGGGYRNKYNSNVFVYQDNI